jgi:putative oligomerization/nucleic acid binding protein
MNRMAAAAIAMTLAAPLAGCGGDEVVRPTVSVSIGQQLIDLKKARDSGALSQREYESQKAQLIKNVDD